MFYPKSHANTSKTCIKICSGVSHKISLDFLPFYSYFFPAEKVGLLSVVESFPYAAQLRTGWGPFFSSLEWGHEFCVVRSLVGWQTNKYSFNDINMWHVCDEDVSNSFFRLFVLLTFWEQIASSVKTARRTVTIIFIFTVSAMARCRRAAGLVCHDYSAYLEQLSLSRIKVVLPWLTIE